MSGQAQEQKLIARAATTTAMVMIAQQTAAKATRDALFLTAFDVSRLPIMLIAAAVTSIIVVQLVTVLMRRLGPSQLVPAAFGLSTMLLLVIWGVSAVAPGVAGVLLYLQVAGMGAVLISGFWSLVTERYDPREAKQQMARIAGGATLGGLLGGLFAERIAATVGVGFMLPSLALMHAGCWWLVRSLRTTQEHEELAAADDASGERAFAILKRSRHLVNLALLLLVLNITSTLVDYAFKEHAAAHHGSGDGLLRFFALFYTVVGVLTFSVQWGLSKLSLEKLGLAGTVAALPATVLVGGAGALLIPGLWAASFARGAEAVLRSSLFRSGYELFYTPIPPAEKRATKTLIDVAFDRAGDIIGSLAVIALLLLPANLTNPGLMIMAIVFCVVALVLTRRLHSGYVASLERSLVNKAVQLDLDDINDATTRSAILNTLGAANLRDAIAELRQSRDQSDAGNSELLLSRSLLSVEFDLGLATRRRKRPTPAPQPEEAPEETDADILACDDADRIVERLKSHEPLDGSLAPALIKLLGWDAVLEPVADRLGDMALEATDALLAALADPDEEFTIRRRIPLVMHRADPEKAVAGLLVALSDRRFEVRFRCAGALARLEAAGTKIAPQAVNEAVLRELKVGERIWNSRRLLDQTADETTDPLLEDVLETRRNRSLEHVFRLLALVPPGRPMRVAYQGLHTTDRSLRGTSLEYLETTLTPAVRDALMPFLDADAADRSEVADPAAVREQLLASQESIRINLRMLRLTDRQNPLNPENK